MSAKSPSARLIITLSAVWLTIGIMAGAYLFPEIRIQVKMLERRVEVPVEKIVEVPVEKIVEKIVIKEVIVEKRVEVPVPMPALTSKSEEEALLEGDSQWRKLRQGMTKSEVEALLGQPKLRTPPHDGFFYWFYDPNHFVHFSEGNLFSSDKVVIWK